MTTALVSVLGHITAGEAIEAVRVKGREVEDFYTVFVVDENTKLLGTVPLDDLTVVDLGTEGACVVVDCGLEVPDRDGYVVHLFQQHDGSRGYGYSNRL